MSREIGTALLAEAAAMGIDARPVATAEDEAQVDLVIAIGMPVAYPDLMRRPATATRLHWFADPLPAAPRGFGERLHRVVPTGWLLDRSVRLVPGLARSARFRAARETAEREREQHKNERLIKATMAHFDHLVLDTTDRAERAALLGLQSRAVPFGYHPTFAGPLGAPATGRDIDVLFFGRFTGPFARRRRIFDEVSGELAAAGIAVTSPDSSGIVGEERRSTLERVKVVLDIQRMEGVGETLRYVFAAAAGAVMVTEPADRRDLLIPGRHIVEAPADKLADAIVELLHDEDRRAAMVAASYELLATDLSMRSALMQLLDVSLVRRRVSP